MKKMLRRISLGVIIISVVYWGVFILMNPIYGKALLDDFAYSQTVKHLVVDGYLKISEWSTATLIFQAYWGTLFSKIFGFSFKALTISTVTIFYFGILAFYGILRRLNVGRFESTVFSILYFAFPWNLLFAYSFMTDIPFISLFMISLYFYICGFEKNELSKLLIGSVFLSFSFLVRQTAIIIVPSILIIFVFKAANDKNFKRLLKYIIWSLAIPIVTILTYSYWLSLDGNKTLAQIFSWDKGTLYILKNLIWPQSLQKVGMVSRYYAETFNRIGIYFAEVVGLIWPAFLIYKLKLDHIKKSFKFMNVVFFILVAGLIAFVFYLPPYSKMIFPKFEGAFFPIEIFSFINFWGGHDAIWYRILWDRSVLLSIPFASIMLLSLGRSFWKKYFYLKPRMPIYFYVGAVVLDIAYFSVYFYKIYLNDSPKYSINEIVTGSWLFLVTLAILVALVVSAGFFVRIRKFDLKRSIELFLFINFISIFLITITLPYVWFEYVISFVPFVFIGLALFAKKFGLNKFLSVLAVLFVLFISFINTKIFHTTNGVVWVTAEKLVKTGIQPKNVQIYEFAWYPWWYYEDTFRATLSKYDENKFQVLKLKTWEDPKLSDLNYTVQFVRNNSQCGNTAILGTKVDTLFVHGIACATSP